MKIPTNIIKRIKKTCSVKPDLQSTFIQGDKEYITNTFFMVSVPKQSNQSESDNSDRRLPIMKIAEEDATPKTADYTRLDLQHLIDTLEIMKANGTKFVDLKQSKLAISLTGYDSLQIGIKTPPATVANALLMGLQL